MVPTRPIRGEDESQEEYEERLDRDYNDISPIKGIFKSFSDAPGGFKEELQEIQWSLGLEYTYHEQFSIRGGYHWEHENKGKPQVFLFRSRFQDERVFTGCCLSGIYSTEQSTRPDTSLHVRFRP